MSIDSGSSVFPTMWPRGSRAASPSRTARPCSATHPVRPWPTGMRRLSSGGVGVAEEGPFERERLAHGGRVVDPVDPDRVVLGQALGLGDDGPGDGLLVAQLVEPPGELRRSSVSRSASVRRDAARRAPPMAVAIWSPNARARARSSAVHS